MTETVFDVWSAPKSYRYKEEAILNHAPQTPGVYELVTFDDQQSAKVLYAGVVTDRTIYDALFEHWNGDRDPKAQDLLRQYPNLYFFFFVDSSAKTPEDLQDLHWAVCQADKPALQNWQGMKHSGRSAGVSFKERSLM